MSKNHGVTPPPKKEGRALVYNHPSNNLEYKAGAVTLPFVPYSKSYMIRVFAMATLSGAIDLVETWHSSRHSCRDIDTMRESLLAFHQTETGVLNVEDAGTVWRFIIAIAALRTNRTVSFSGSTRLFDRPIAPLVNALCKLGAEIDFSSDKVAAITVSPSKEALCGGNISSETGTFSSQFLSALMLIGPYLSSPLRIAISSGQRSKPYSELTYRLMQLAGAEVVVEDGFVEIRPSGYDKRLVATLLENPEPDWTALSYTYSWSAMPEAPRSIFVPDCYRETLQGDIALSKIMESFGVVTRFFPKGILIERIKPASMVQLHINLSDHIDLVPSIMMTCLALERPFRFLRVGALKYKESNRFECLLSICRSLGYKIEAGEDELFWGGAKVPASSPVTIDPCNDHRIAMAASIMGLRRNDLKLLTPEVVEKSYPFFWQDAAAIGLTLQD